jgi:hypothetical protein
MLLTKDVNWKVRRTVALSICHVAKALNADIIVCDLFPVFDSFCRHGVGLNFVLCTNQMQIIVTLCRDIDEVKNAAGALRANAGEIFLPPPFSRCCPFRLPVVQSSSLIDSLI